MPIDPDKARGAQLPDGEPPYTQDQVILYHLGLGAGVPATDPKGARVHLREEPQVLPSFAVIPAFGSMGGIGKHPGDAVQLRDAAPRRAGDHSAQAAAHRGEARDLGAHPEIYDKGKAALVILESTAKDADSGEPLFTTGFSLFIRGEGGWGGDGGPKAGNQAPDRAPDGVIERSTLPQQALI